MVAGADDLVVVDTNVLVAATDRSRTSHAAATALLETDERRLAVTPQIVREYLAVATRPTAANGLGLDGAVAVGNTTRLLEDLVLLTEGAGSTRQLLELVAAGPTAGRQVHDANVVAVALASGARGVVTDDARHFSRWADVIAVEALRPVSL